MQRGDMLIITLCLIACAALIWIIDWRGMYEFMLRSLEYEIYGR
jgi:hypothetical protein